MRIGVRTLLALTALVAYGALTGVAHAGAGTFSGAITPTDCGPMHDVTVAPGDTTIDAVAAEYVSANDITLDLYDPSGKVIYHGDTATSPEAAHVESANLTPGTWHAQVCPFPGGVVSSPYDYTGSWQTTQVPVPAVTPGSDTGGAGGSSTIRRVVGKLVFSPATVIDAQRTEGEPLNWLDKDGNYWESGPWGTTTQNS